jgi:hypothetical protein
LQRSFVHAFMFRIPDHNATSIQRFIVFCLLF